MKINREEAILKFIFGMMFLAVGVMVVAAAQIPSENSCCCVEVGYHTNPDGHKVYGPGQDSKPESGR